MEGVLGRESHLSFTGVDGGSGLDQTRRSSFYGELGVGAVTGRQRFGRITGGVQPITRTTSRSDPPKRVVQP